MATVRPLRRRRTLSLGLAFALVGAIAAIGTATAAPDRAGRQLDSLIAWYASLPDEGIAGTRDVTQIVLGHSTWTDNGAVLFDWYNLEIHLGVQTIDATGQLVAPNWIGSYFPVVIPVEPVAFVGNTVSAARTMRWQCDIGPCPVMPATINVSISALGVGSPRTTAVGGPDGTAVGQEWDAVVNVDSGGVLALPTLRYALLFRGRSQVLTR